MSTYNLRSGIAEQKKPQFYAVQARRRKAIEKMSPENVVSITSQVQSCSNVAQPQAVGHHNSVTTSAEPHRPDHQLPHNQHFDINADSNDLPPLSPQVQPPATIPVVSTDNNIIMTVLEQNRLLISELNQLIQQRSTSNSPSVQSIGSSGYYVMPDFHNTLPVFTGNESHTEASQWIQSINSTADLHNWPDSFKLEIVRTKLNGPCRNWYIGRSFVDWTNFEQQFISTFVNTQLSIVDRMKLLIARHQKKGESIIEYFHDKARMCRELSLSFYESKQQIVEGIFSRDLCMYLLSRSHLDENQLITDIVTFTKINDSRQARFKNNERSVANTTLTKTAVTTQSSPESSSKQPFVRNSNAKPLSNKTKSWCYNCGSLDHISPSCTQPKRLQGSCFKCGSSEHKITSCPQSQFQFNPTNSNSQHQLGPSNATMVLQPSDSVTPAYVICIDIVIAGSCISNVLAVVDTGSPISLIKEKLFPLDSKSLISPISTGIVGINGSELVVLNQIYADIKTT